MGIYADENRTLASDVGDEQPTRPLPLRGHTATRAATAPREAARGVDGEPPPHGPSPQREGAGARIGRALHAARTYARSWFAANTFIPPWAPPQLRAPAVGYLAATMLQVLAVAVVLLLTNVFGSFAFEGAPALLAIALVALNWGAAPAVVATVLGGLLINYVVFPPNFALTLGSGREVSELLIFFATGGAISVLASQTERERRAANAAAARLAAERARLDAIIEAAPDMISIYDASGAIVRLDRAGHDTLGGADGRDARDTLAERPPAYALCSIDGSPLRPDTLPVARALTGEAIQGLEVRARRISGEDRVLEVSAAPFRDAWGAIVGAVAISRDVTDLRQFERERLLREREEARASGLALQQANERMDEFLRIASHELKTPLTTIKANVQLSLRRLERLDPDAPDPRDEVRRVLPAKGLLERAERQMGRLDRLIGDLLDVSRIRAGRLELCPEPTDLAAIVRDAVQEQRQTWPKRSINLGLPQEQASVMADRDRVGQVVANYLTNALKYSPAEAPVAVSLTREGDGWHVAVRDRGPGIPTAELSHIWERFHRVPGIEVLSGSGVGLGLGLHISKSIVERHGGTVGVESAVGEGSAFWFTLPAAGDATADSDSPLGGQ